MSDLADLLAAHLRLVREHEALKVRVANLIRPGKVTDRDHEKGVRIDLGGGTDDKPNKSDWVKPSDASGVTSYLPREGEQGWLISPNGDQQMGGFVPLTHSDEKKNPAPDGDTTVLFNRDDVNISLKDGVLTMTVKKFVVKAGDSTLTIDKDGHTLDGKTITEKSGDNSFKLDGAGHTFKGGKVSHDERNIGSGHVHSGVMSGGAKTQQPDP